LQSDKKILCRFIKTIAFSFSLKLANLKPKEGGRMKFSIEKIDHVQVAAPKGTEKDAVEFYSGVLGMKEVQKPDALKERGGAWFEFGDYQLHVGVEEPFSPAQKAHPAFKVKGFEALQQHLATEGVELKNDDSIPGVLRFFISDPFGNRLEFLKSDE
jgi:catechol 2,3-dioxygenase-like lactoylglutathione lyase family enzyme